MKAVIDSNILIYYLNAALTAQGKALVKRAQSEGAYVSVITRIEILGWPHRSPEALRRAERLLSQFNEQALTNPIVKRCITLRQQHRIKTPDVIIAATALHLNLPLVTRNVDDFKVVQGLQLINPFALTSNTP